MGFFTKRVAVRAVELSIGAFCTEFRCEQLCDDDMFWIVVNFLVFALPPAGINLVPPTQPRYLFGHPTAGTNPIATYRHVYSYFLGIVPCRCRMAFENTLPVAGPLPVTGPLPLPVAVCCRFDFQTRPVRFSRFPDQGREKKQNKTKQNAARPHVW